MKSMNRFKFKINEGDGTNRSVIFRALSMIWTLYKKGFPEVKGANLFLYQKPLKSWSQAYYFISVCDSWKDEQMKKDLLFYFQLCWLRGNNPPQTFPYDDFDSAWGMLDVYRANPLSAPSIMRDIRTHLDEINKKRIIK